MTNLYQKCMAIIVASVLLTAVFVYKYPSINVSLKSIKEQVYMEVQQSLAIQTFNDSDIVNASKHYLCPEFWSFGRFANKIFIYASNYGIARSKGMQLYITGKCPLLKLFKIKISQVINGTTPCKKRRRLIESRPAAFNKKILNFTNKEDVQVIRYLQSWRYFDAYRDELRQKLQFRDDIRVIVNSQLQVYIQKHGLDNKTVVLVGVHVRRGDLQHGGGMGQTMASKEYLKTAVDWYNSRYKNLIFIVASDTMGWTKKNMPHDILVSYVEGKPPHIDLAIIGSCNHFIMTVGTFGWWGGWLTGGNVIYYKWPARKKSTWENIYNYTDFYYPHWIGL